MRAALSACAGGCEPPAVFQARFIKEGGFSFFFSRKKPARSYDPATQQPALRCSICTGEQVAGFISPDGHFEDVQLIRTPQELDAFRARYGIPPECPLKKIY